MKNLMTAVLLTMVIGLPVCSLAQYGTTTSPLVGDSGADNIMVTGIVVSVDPSISHITVNDALTQKDKTFTVAQKEDLENIKAGDKVTVEVQRDDNTKATHIIKQ